MAPDRENVVMNRRRIDADSAQRQLQFVAAASQEKHQIVGQPPSDDRREAVAGVAAVDCDVLLNDAFESAELFRGEGTVNAHQVLQVARRIALPGANRGAQRLALDEIELKCEQTKRQGTVADAECGARDLLGNERLDERAVPLQILEVRPRHLPGTALGRAGVRHDQPVPPGHGGERIEHHGVEPREDRGRGADGAGGG